MHLDHLKGVLCPSTAEKFQSSDTVCELLKVTSSELHCSPKGPYFRDRVPIGTFFDFLGPYFQRFGYTKNIDSVCTLHVRNNE